MQNVIGVIFADSHYADVKDLTVVRPLGALPINGRYRSIDFTLSNMVNSGMINVAVVTQNNYHSLMGHLGSGKHWNLARKRYGLILFPPFSNLSSTGSDSRIDILYGILDFLKRSTQEYVLLSESNLVINQTFNGLFEKHIESGADISVVYQKIDANEHPEIVDTYFFTDDNENITAVETGENISGSTKRYFGYVLINKQVLISIIEHSKIRGKKGYLTSLESYYNTSMEILNKEVREELFNQLHPIYTKDKDTTPTRYLSSANVKNCFIADGCVVDGTIENSIIFRSVKIKKGTTIRNSIILQQSDIGENVRLENVILDKKVVIRDDKELVGTKEFPVVVGKGRVI